MRLAQVMTSAANEGKLTVGSSSEASQLADADAIQVPGDSCHPRSGELLCSLETCCLW